MPYSYERARDLLLALSHRHDDTWMAFVEAVISTSRKELRTFWLISTFFLQMDCARLEPVCQSVFVNMYIRVQYLFFFIELRLRPGIFACFMLYLVTWVH